MFYAEGQFYFDEETKQYRSKETGAALEKGDTIQVMFENPVPKITPEMVHGCRIVGKAPADYKEGCRTWGGALCQIQ